MNKFTYIFLTIMIAFSVVVNADQITEPFCYWSGTSPACQGSCETGEFVAATSKYGDGKTCITGVKKYCCKMPPQWLAMLSQFPFFVGNGNGPAHINFPAAGAPYQ